MASALSEEEFHRMQLQLLELRTNNYELEGKCKRQEREFLSLKEKADDFEKELQKANKVILKSRKAKEVDILIQENDGLQRKLQSQEEEFQLQNETLMQELSHLVASNENYEKQLEALKEGRKDELNSSPSAKTDLEDEIRRMQAQNTALQKTLRAHQENHEKQVSALKEQLKSAASQRMKINDNINEYKQDPLQTDFISNNLNEQEAVGGDEEIVSNNKEVLLSPTKEEYLKELTGLKLNLDTELEENRILKEQLLTTEKKLKSETATLQEEAEKLSEKLKKKQESYIQLQNEKEEQFRENGKKMEELQAARDRDQKYYTDQISKLQQELEHRKGDLANHNQSLSWKVKELEAQVVALQQQVEAANIVGNQQLHDQNLKYQHYLGEVEAHLAHALQQKEDLLVQLQESQRANGHTLEQLHAAQQERDTQIQSLQEINKVAEKRKNLLDELAIKYQRDCDAHRDQIQFLEREHTAEVSKLKDHLLVEKERSAELEKVRMQLEDAHLQIQSSEETKGWLERRLNETELSLNASQEEFEDRIANLQETSFSDKEVLREDYEKAIQEGKKREESLLQEIEQFHRTVVKLQQEIKDSVDEKKIHEKKGMTMLKDLKRQLHAERKRGEKLQERLQEILSDPKRRHSVEELFKPIDPNDPWRAESSSVSSWSAGASGISGLKELPQSPNHTCTPPSDFDQEHNELLNRVALSQQKNWTLEEKVSHLETSNAAMAEDLLQKTAIIEYYVMEGRRDPRPAPSPHEDRISLKKVLDLVNRGDDNMKEMNRKLQRMLEETLTKNMHLQRDLETLSQEVVRLSKHPSRTSGETDFSAQPNTDASCTSSKEQIPVPTCQVEASV